MFYCMFEIKYRLVYFINGTYVPLHRKYITTLNNGKNKRDYTYHNKRYR